MLGWWILIHAADIPDDEKLLGKKYGSVARQVVVGHYGRLASAHAPAAAIANLCSQTFPAHQPGDPMLAAALTQITQVPGDFAVAVDAGALQPRLLDQSEYASIVPSPC